MPAYVPPAVRDAIMAKASPHVGLAMQIALATGWRRASVLGLRLGARRLAARADPRPRQRPRRRRRAGPSADRRAARDPARGGRSGRPTFRPDRHLAGPRGRRDRRGFDRARRAAGYPHVQFKSLRHSVAQEVFGRDRLDGSGRRGARRIRQIEHDPPALRAGPGRCRPGGARGPRTGTEAGTGRMKPQQICLEDRAPGSLSPRHRGQVFQHPLQLAALHLRTHCLLPEDGRAACRLKLVKLGVERLPVGADTSIAHKAVWL